jgi:hypothetical protein
VAEHLGAGFCLKADGVFVDRHLAYLNFQLLEVINNSSPIAVLDALGGHLKSGHMRSLQNRPYGLA